MEILALAGHSILVVEDEPLIALEIEGLLEYYGANVLSAGTLATALVLAQRPGLSAAILDYSLGEEDSWEICWRLDKRRIPIMFYTGYSHLVQQWPSAAIIAKPASVEVLLGAVSELLHVKEASTQNDRPVGVR
jgi:DNA-binding response OmpR family regulator